MALANIYSQGSQLITACFIPAGLSMALFISYGSAALPSVLFGSFAAAMLASQSLLPDTSWQFKFFLFSIFYALGHSLAYLLVTKAVRHINGGYIRLENTSHIFNVLYASLFASLLSTLLASLTHAYLTPKPFDFLLDDFLIRWMASLAGVLCFALSFITLLAFFRCERFFAICYIDTQHLRRGLILDRGIPWFILFYSLAIFSLDWLGKFIGVQQFVLGWMGIITLFTLAWAATKMSYGAISILVAAFSMSLLLTLSVFWADYHVAHVQTLLPIIAIAGTFIWSLSNSESNNKVLHELANTDELTGLANRRQWFFIAQKEFSRVQRHQSKLCVILIDLDYFKKVNDGYGHQTGDLALQHAAHVMHSQLRGDSTLCRYGGEEFALLLPECQMDMAYMVAERVRRTLQNAPLHTANSTLKLTASLGVANSTNSDIRVEDVIARADEALYQAKSEGRNKVCPDLMG